MSKWKYISVVLLLLVFASAFFILSTLSQKEAVEGEKEAVEAKLSKAEASIKQLRVENQDLNGKIKEAERKEGQLSNQLNDLRTKSSNLESERDDWKNKVEALRGERDKLMVKLQEKPEPEIIYKEVPVPTERPTIEIPEMPEIPEGEMHDRYWAEVLKEKAALALDIRELQSELTESAIEIEELKKQNSDLELKISALKEEKDEIEREIKYNEDLINTLSIDLAREKSDKKYISERIETLKEENASFRGQIKELTSAKVTLGKSIARLSEDKKEFERKLIETEGIIQNRIDEILDIKRSLDRRLRSSSGVSLSGKEVELPPIIVSAPASLSQKAAEFESPSALGYIGRVVSVNEDSNFVIIDIGENDGVRIGDRLSAYRDSKYIAGLEIIQTRKDISAADIKQKGVQIKVGDTIR